MSILNVTTTTTTPSTLLEKQVYKRKVLNSEERQEVLMLESLMDWYNQNPDHLKTVLTVFETKMMRNTKREPRLSLTLLDWIVSRYAKFYSCTFIHPETQQLIDIHEEYVLQLKGYSKRRSDPFCRSQRFPLTIQTPEGEKKIVTSVRQLNFMKFLTQTGIFKYIQDNLPELYEKYIESKSKSKGHDGTDNIGFLSAVEPVKFCIGQFQLDFSQP